MILNRIHASYVHSRRARRLAELLLPRLPEGGRVLDVGCGDGLLASVLQGSRSVSGELTFEGIDIVVRPDGVGRGTRRRSNGGGTRPWRAARRPSSRCRC